MSQPRIEISVSGVTAACAAGLADATEALARALELQADLSVGEPRTWTNLSEEPRLSGPALAMEFTVGGTCLFVLIAEASGLLPAWYRAPDPTGESRLATLAQELGTSLLPEELFPESFRARHVSDVAAALAAAGPVGSVQAVPFARKGSDDVVLWLLWPFARPGAAFFSEPPGQSRSTTEASGHAPQPAEGSPTHSPRADTSRASAPEGCSAAKERLPSKLPSYMSSLLSIPVPVSVILAATKYPVEKIRELAPGTVIQFKKSCEQTLSLAAENCIIGEGEAVKVGDKFGLRIRRMTPPPQRFVPVAPRKEA